MFKFDQKLHIYPEPIKPSYDLIKDLMIVNNQDENNYEFDRIEEAKQGESLSRISWKHYSIKQKLFTKKFTNSENNKEILIDIDLLNKKNLEKALSNAVYLIEHYYNKKINFALKYKQFTSKYSNSLTHKNDLLKFTANAKRPLTNSLRLHLNTPHACKDTAITNLFLKEALQFDGSKPDCSTTMLPACPPSPRADMG